MDYCNLLYDFDGTYINMSMGDFENWLLSNIDLSSARQLLSEFIVEQSIGENHGFNVISSDSFHTFNVDENCGAVILCDFDSSCNDYLHLDKWSFFVVDSNSISGTMNIEQLLTYNPEKYDFYSLAEHIRYGMCN